MNGIGTIIKEAPERSPAFSACEDTVRSMRPSRRPSTDHVGPQS